MEAAVSAADAGHNVLLIKPTSRIGGMLTNGLSNTDFRSFESLSGFFFDFSKRVEAYYRKTYGDDSDQIVACCRGAHGEPHFNLKILLEMIHERPTIRIETEQVLIKI